MTGAAQGVRCAQKQRRKKDNCILEEAPEMSRSSQETPNEVPAITALQANLYLVCPSASQARIKQTRFQ